ncbi:hypothetical protein [Nocardia sp. NPDC004860]|uniref:hypothetical protein n=1 Tax=Nocardia sp. NPDC004860 TaxID=3154557 RepID=UPI0033AAD00D
MTDPISAGRFAEGLFDTCVLIDIDLIEDSRLPVRPRISTVTLAELGLGIALAATPQALALRTERLLAIEHGFTRCHSAPHPLDGSRRWRNSLSHQAVARNPAKWP